jgi:hypothetical protein
MPEEPEAPSIEHFQSTSSQQQMTPEKLPGQLTWFDVSSFFFLALLLGFGLAIGSVYILRDLL